MGKVVALIPARCGSTGIKMKNLKEVNGVSLVRRAALQAKMCAEIDSVVVSTDCDEVSRQVKDVASHILGRPEEFRHDNSVQEVDRLLLWMIEQWQVMEQADYEMLLLLYPTSPLRKVSTITQCISLMSKEDCDSVLTLHKSTDYLWRVRGGKAIPINYDPAKRGPRQLEYWNQWVENKAVYATRKGVIEESGCRIGKVTGYVEIDSFEGIDVDSENDLHVCNALIEKGLVEDEIKKNG